ncbi:unnamed protein product [Ectocarpus sp. 12 AP-2014]
MAVASRRAAPDAPTLTAGGGYSSSTGQLASKTSTPSLPHVQFASAGKDGAGATSSASGRSGKKGGGSSQLPASAAEERGAAAAAAAAAANIMPALPGTASGMTTGNANISVSSVSTAAAKVRVSFGGLEAGTVNSWADGGGPEEPNQREGSSHHRKGDTAAAKHGIGAGGTVVSLTKRGATERRSSSGSDGTPAVGSSVGSGGPANGNSGVVGAGGAGKPRRRAQRGPRGDDCSRGSMDTLTTTSVSTVTRGVALQWKPRLNVELGSFVYPSLMLEKSACLQIEAPGDSLAGGSRRRLAEASGSNGNLKLGRQQTRRKKSLVSAVAGGGDAGAPEVKSRNQKSRGGTAPDSKATLPPLTWVLSAEPEQTPSGLVTFQFSQPLQRDGGNGGSVTLEMNREDSSCSNSNLTIGTVGSNREGGVLTSWPGGDDQTSLCSSKLSKRSFEYCLRAGEGKLRDEIHRLRKEIQQISGDDAKDMKGGGVLAAQTRQMMTNDKTRAAVALMSAKSRASAVQYDKLVNRPGKGWTRANRIVSKMKKSDFDDIKKKDKMEMRAELKRLAKERQEISTKSRCHLHEEEDRRIAKEFQEMQQKVKMANGRLRLKQMVSVEEKASSREARRQSALLAKESYFSQFQQTARTRQGGYFSGSGGVVGTEGGRGAPPLTANGFGGGNPFNTARTGLRQSTSPPSSRGSIASPGRPGSAGVHQAPDSSKRQAMARDVFIVACLELGLHPDLSRVQWNLGGIDLSNFGLGDQLAGALAASMKHSPPESLVLRDNRMTDVPLGVVISALDVDSLMTLDLSENKVGPKAMERLCSFLEDGSCLETLVLTATHLGDAEIAPLCETLMDNDVLLSLNLSRNKLRSAGASSLASMLSSSGCGLHELDISWNCCSGKGTVELGEALKRQRTLRKLELAFNSFSEDSTIALASALLDNRQLSSLDLSWNRVGGRASLALSRMLCLNTTLRKLNLNGNPLTETGGRSIVRALLGGSGCDVSMRGCSFAEDTDILFDRNYPPPLISLDVDLKNAFQCCVLHELIWLAQAKPGSKFVEVYRHSGGGRGRTPVALQVVEEAKGIKRASVVDTATGKPWIPPDSGWLSVKFKVSRELPSIKDVLNPEAAWTAMMLIMGQESDSDRMNILRLVLRDTYVTTESGQKLIDQLSHMGIYPRDVVEMVWTRVVDPINLYEFLSHNVEHSARRDVVNILTHERFKFNWDNPTGHYRLEMQKKSHREIMMLLSMVHSREILQGKKEGRGDTSQGQNWSNFRNARMDKEPVELVETSVANLPVSGVLEFDYVSTAKAPPDCARATDSQVQALQESLHLLPRRTFGEKINYMLAVLQLQQAAARYYFSTPQATAVTALFGRTWDLENFDAVFATLPAGAEKQAASRLGYLNVLNPLKIARHYELNMMFPDERRLIKLLLDTSPLEKGDNLLEDHTSDLQIIDLYAGLGRLADESRPLVVRLWYCDIGIKGNVPNWAVREKLLDKFLVGGKPVPDRVLEIGRMYKRMADAGYLAKEPGLGSADIAKAHERFLKHLQEAKRTPAAAQTGRGTRRSVSVNRAQQAHAGS